MDIPHRLYREAEVDRLYRDLLAWEQSSPAWGTPGTIEPDDAADAGVSESAARADHQHAIATATAGAATPGDSAAEGTASSFARSDHKHSLPAFGTGAGTFCQGNDARLSDARTPTSHHTTHESGGGDAIKLDDLAAPDDNTDLNVSTAKHGLTPKLPNDSAKFLNGVGGYATPGIGGVQVWFPGAPPSSPSAYDDEFDSVSGLWSTWDPGTMLSTNGLDTNKHMYKLESTGSGTIRHAGIYQAVPGSEFAIYTRVGLPPFAGASGMAAGLFVSDDIGTNPTTADFRDNVYTQNTTQVLVASRTWTAYNGSSSLQDSRAYVLNYLRIRCNGTAFNADISPDGLSWHTITTRTLGFTPTHMGLLLGIVDAQVGTGYFEFFRVFSGAGTSGRDATNIGRFV